MGAKRGRRVLFGLTGFGYAAFQTKYCYAKQFSFLAVMINDKRAIRDMLPKMTFNVDLLCSLRHVTRRLVFDTYGIIS